jgi:uncharacterized coiled-coil protein SlyX
MKTRIPPVLITFALVCFALVQNTQAVNPPPDGGYPNFTTAEGTKALQSLTTGSANTAVGWFSLFSTATGSFNTATGAGSLLFNTADANTAFGAAALLFNTAGENNTATGAGALLNSTAGSENTANGSQALSSNTTGDANTAIGFGTLISNTTGNDNTALGFEAGSGVTTANNVIAIGTAGANVSNGCFIGRIRDVTTANADAIPVMIDSAGQLGTTSSARRFKKEIQPMDKASESLLALKPVTFHYKSDNTSTPQFGLIAEEVAEMNPDLVVRDKNGEIYTVRYDQVNAMLLNEFLKEHRTVQELKSVVAKQEAAAAQQQKQIEALTAGLQRVSAQLELNKPAPQTVKNTD